MSSINAVSLCHADAIWPESLLVLICLPSLGCRDPRLELFQLDIGCITRMASSQASLSSCIILTHTVSTDNTAWLPMPIPTLT